MASPQLLQLLAEQREAFCQGFASGFVELARLQCRELALAGASGRRRQAEMSATEEQAGGGAGVEASAFDNVKAKIQHQPEAECDSNDAMEEHDGTVHAVRGLADSRDRLQDDADTAAGRHGGSASNTWQLVSGRWLRDHLDVETGDAIDTMKVLTGSQCVAVQRAETSEEGGEAAVRTAAGVGVPDVPAVARAAALPLSGGGDAATSDATSMALEGEMAAAPWPASASVRTEGALAVGLESASASTAKDGERIAGTGCGGPGYTTKESETRQSELGKPRAACPGPAGLVPLPSERWVTPNSHAEGRGTEKFMEGEGITGGCADAEAEPQHQGAQGFGGASAEPLCASQECAGSPSPRTSLVYEGNGRVKLAASWTLAAGASDEKVTVCGGRRLIGVAEQYGDVLAGLSSGKCGGSDGSGTAAGGGMGDEAQHQGTGFGGASVEPLCDSEFAGSSSPRTSGSVEEYGVRLAGRRTLADDASDKAGAMADELSERVTVCGGRRPNGETEQHVSVLTGLSTGTSGGSGGGAAAADCGVDVGASQHQGSIGLGGASAEPLCDSHECAGSSSPRTSLVCEDNGLVRLAGRCTLADDALDEQVTVCGGRRLNGETEQYVDVLAGLSSGKWGGSDGGTAAHGGVGVGELRHQGSIGLGGASAEPLCDSQEYAGSSSPRTPLVFVYEGRGRPTAGRWTLADDATDEQVTVCGGRRLIGGTQLYAGVQAGLSSGGMGGSERGGTAAEEATVCGGRRPEARDMAAGSAAEEATLDKDDPECALWSQRGLDEVKEDLQAGRLESALEKYVMLIGVRRGSSVSITTQPLAKRWRTTVCVQGLGIVGKGATRRQAVLDALGVLSRGMAQAMGG